MQPTFTSQGSVSTYNALQHKVALEWEVRSTSPEGLSLLSVLHQSKVKYFWLVFLKLSADQARYTGKAGDETSEDVTK